MSSSTSSSKTWIVKNKPENELRDDTFELTTKDLAELKDGEILVEVKYLCGMFRHAVQKRSLDTDNGVCLCRPFSPPSHPCAARLVSASLAITSPRSNDPAQRSALTCARLVVLNQLRTEIDIPS